MGLQNICCHVAAFVISMQLDNVAKKLNLTSLHPYLLSFDPFDLFDPPRANYIFATMLQHS